MTVTVTGAAERWADADNEPRRLPNRAARGIGLAKALSMRLLPPSSATGQPLRRHRLLRHLRLSKGTLPCEADPDAKLFYNDFGLDRANETVKAAGKLVLMNSGQRANASGDVGRQGHS